jgi:hypothetical protein
MPAPAIHAPCETMSLEARSCRIVTVFVFLGGFRS